MAGCAGFVLYILDPDLSIGFSAGELRSRSKQQVKMGAGPRNHLKLRYQIAHISRPNRAAFFRPQVLMVAPSRNHLNLRGTQVLNRAGPRNQFWC